MAITKKQKEVYDYIYQYLQEFGYAPTQKEIKDHFGLKSFGSVQRYIKYLISAGYLEDSAWNARRGLAVKQDPTKSPQDGLVSIPLLGAVAAGNPILAIEQADEMISIPQYFIKASNRYFALNVTGNSMIEDGILDGDVIVCKSSPTAKNGETIVAILDGEATVKKFFHKDHKVELHPANKTMSPIIVSAGDFKIAGLVVGLFRTFQH
ncbi:MAG: transcriptional repressor LexA [Bacteriovoracaceae bacterium]|nr:transcriptional repressor LexA [Bacteriovoracaceae bacterium]